MVIINLAIYYLPLLLSFRVTESFLLSLSPAVKAEARVRISQRSHKATHTLLLSSNIYYDREKDDKESAVT